MRVAVLFGAVAEGAPPDELDVLVEVAVVEQALRELGHEVLRVPFSLAVDRALEDLRRASPSVVFNLVETVGGTGALSHFATGALDYAGIPYTGAPNEAMVLTSNKVLTKRCLAWAGLPTPPWATRAALAAGAVVPFPVILKPLCEDASVGLDEGAILQAPKDLSREIGCRSDALGRECFAEHFVEGREFNLSVLEGEDGPTVLPPAEILFLDYPPERPRLVCYRAKWEEGSFEFEHTPRSFQFLEEDRGLLRTLRELSLSCWSELGLRGYARVDLRVDREGRPWVLEVNANPCISPDGGFTAAAREAGLSPRAVVAELLACALRHAPRRA
jgi:D-alanine-D-alanine ligase